MKDKPLIILGSARKDCDIEQFVYDIFQETPADIINLLDYKIHHYSYEHAYAEDDQFMFLVDMLLEHQLIIFATPVYWYSMSGHLKVFFDRITDLVTIHKSIGRQFKNKETALIVTGADAHLPPGFEVPFELTSNYLDMLYKGSVYKSIKYPEPDQLTKTIEAFRMKLIE